MSKDNLFDGITRILASPMPRRQAFRLIAGGLASGTLVSLLKPQQAHASSCGDTCSQDTKTCKPDTGTRCPDNCPCKFDAATGDGCHCCASVCPDIPACCKPGQCCVDGKCATCPPGSCCDKNNQCQKCPPDKQCCKDGECVKCPGNQAHVTYVPGGPPEQADATLQNAVLGINSITLAKAVNCTVAGLPMTAKTPIKTPITRRATKIDQTKPAQFLFTVCTSCGCCPMDPIFTVLTLTTGRWVRQTFADIPAADHFLTVTNGNPGLEKLHIWVNRKHYATLRLGDNETQNLDLAPAMTAQNNTISLIGAGELGASASVIVVDTPPAAATPAGGVGATAAAPAQGSSPRHNHVWGPLEEETEENSHLHAANVARQTIQVNFSGALGAGAASPSVFTVEVNGKAKTVQGGHVQAGASGGKDLILQLPQGALHRGDSVDVYWEKLQDAKGRPLSGHVPLTVQ